LRYRSQPGAYTEDLRQRVAVHRDTVIAALASRPATPALSRLEQREALAAIKRGDVVRIVSDTLGESVYWVRDEETAERIKREPVLALLYDYRGEVIYTLAELRELAGKSPEFLRGIHQFKKTFGATLEKVNQGVTRDLSTPCADRLGAKGNDSER
jgi:hypothetical protein